jgi:hypothetical protein
MEDHVLAFRFRNTNKVLRLAPFLPGHLVLEDRELQFGIIGPKTTGRRSTAIDVPL